MDKYLKATILDRDTIKLLEDGKTGDFISLKNLSSINSSEVSDFINKEVNNLYSEKINDLKKQYQEHLINKINNTRLEERQSLTEIHNKEKQTLIEEKNKELEQYKINLSNKDKEIELVKGKLNSDFLKEKHLLTESHNKEIEGYKINLSDKEREIEVLKERINSVRLEEKEKLDQIYDEDLKEIRNDYDKRIDEKNKKIEDLNLNIQKGVAENKKLEELVDFYKDFKQSLSTKMVGESLEVYCHNEFEKIRATSFKNDYFEKDNTVIEASKGDFIYKAYDEDNTELISIMFEMKNENETTASKKKNEDFFKELDKDRNAKKCEYAILVSLLEKDSELYNSGIVDVSHRYQKMYVIRPQFFIPIISILRNSALNSLSYKKQLQIEKNKEIDLLSFENKLQDFKSSWAQNITHAKIKYDEAIKHIDNSIEQLQKVKESLLTSLKHFNAADNKVESLSFKGLKKIIEKYES